MAYRDVNIIKHKVTSNKLCLYISKINDVNKLNEQKTQKRTKAA